MSDSRAPFRLGAAPAAPAGFPPDVAPNQIIFASHINAIRNSVALWPGDVNAQSHTLSNVNLVNATGVMIDPTTTPGDLISRGAVATERLPVGTTGQVLTADTALVGKLKWATPIGAVSSVFGRVGAIVAAAGDYTAAQVLNAVSDAVSYANPTWLASLAWAKIAGAPATYAPSPHTHDASEIVSGRMASARLGTGIADASVYLRGDGVWAAAGGGSGGGVSTVFGRAGAVIAQTGDYNAAQVTGAVQDKTSVKGDLLVRSAVQIERFGAGADGQALVSDSTQPAGLKWSTVTGTWIDPTTTRGDLLVRNSVTIVRLPVGGDGQVLTADNASANGVKWANPTGGGGAVSSVFGRTGAIVAAPGDYTAAQVLNALSDLNAYANPSWLVSLTWGKITGTPAFLVDPTTTKGDVLARSATAVGRLPVGSDGQVLTADAASTLGVRWAQAAAAAQTPWTSDIDGAGFTLKNVGKIGIGTAAPSYLLSVVAAPATNCVAEFVAPSGQGTYIELGVKGQSAELLAAANGDFQIGCFGLVGNVFQLIRSGAVTNTMTLKGGNVGIGTTNPGCLFQALTSSVGASAAAFSGPAVNIYLTPFAGAPNPGSNAAQADAGLIGLATAAGHFGLNQGDLAIVTQTRTGTAGGNRIVFGHPITNVGDYVFGMYYNRGKLGIGQGTPTYPLDVLGDVNCTGAFRVNGVALSGGGVTTQTQPARALNTIYQNTTGKSIFVNAVVSVPVGGSISALSDSATNPGTIVAAGYNASTTTAATVTLPFWVLPGNYYKVSGGTSIFTWIEWV